MSLTTEERPHHDGGHAVRFVRDADELAATVGASLGDALRNGDAVIQIATADHAYALGAELASSVDVRAARSAGRLLEVGAADALSRFVVDGATDARAFDSVVGGLVGRAGAGGRRVHVYGEMVAVLWDAGDVDRAIEVERLWNQLGDAPYSLTCGYPYGVAGGRDADEASVMCHLHDRILADTDADDVLQRFEAGLRSPALVRRFVSKTLVRWGLTALSDDALLVANELSANAVVHANSTFTVRLTRREHGVRIEVGDATAAPPRLAPAKPTGGRGLVLVDRLATGWGHRVTADGKFVWAELVDPERR